MALIVGDLLSVLSYRTIAPSHSFETIVCKMQCQRKSRSPPSPSAIEMLHSSKFVVMDGANLARNVRAIQELFKPVFLLENTLVRIEDIKHYPPEPVHIAFGITRVHSPNSILARVRAGTMSPTCMFSLSSTPLR